ncbi:MAG TPA: cytochrome c oxidase subunit 3 family protein [Bryobacteraceae bacterium]|nr:cytochrome c oxidase subunit 3 family protein [Bryobacteraceae bacterium]
MSTATVVHDEHEAHLQHHFADSEQQAETSKLGMWLFLATEILLFGGLFVGFGISQIKYPEAFLAAHEHLQKPLGFLNTVVLLISSWTMVMGVWSARNNKQKALQIFLLLTIACACIFLGVKYFEYSHKFEDGLLPGRFYTHSPMSDHQFVFFSFYFMMTGLHGFHILGGICVLTWIYVRARRGEFSSAYYTPVDLVGLYWHLVDMIWIYLFPLLYLIK